MKTMMGIIAVVCATVLGTNASAESSADIWQAPAVSYGSVRSLPDAAVPLNPEHSYKLLFNIRQGGKSPAELIPGVVRAARFLNLAQLAGVPKENVQLAIVIQGPATQSALKHEVFRERFGEKNHNLALFAELREAGVKIFVCGQALAHMQLQTDWVAEDVKVAVAAMTVVVEYQLRGYHVMP